MCRDYSFERCFGIYFVKNSSGSYFVYQKRGDSNCRLGYVIRRKEFPYWFFSSYVFPYGCSFGVTRISAIRNSMEEYVAKYPCYNNLPFFPKCDCLLAKNKTMEV